MNVIKDFYETNEKVVKKTLPALKMNPLLFVIGIPYGIIYLAVGIVASSISFFGGMILLLIKAALIADYLFLISKTLTGRKFDIEDIKFGFKVHFIQVYAILFLLWFIDYAIMLFINPISYALTGGILSLIVNIVVYVILSAIPETIYQKHLDRGDLVVYSVKFVRENPFQWLFPNIFFIGIAIFIYNLIVNIISTIFGNLIGSLIGITLIQGLIGFIMIYRGFLFQILSSSSLRKRMFMRNMYKN